MKRLAAVVWMILLAQLVFAEPGQARDWHVTPDGKDNAAGTADAPLSLEHALRQIRNETEEQTIILHAGTYSGENMVRSPTTDSDTAPKRLTIRAAEGAKVLFDGGGIVSEYKQEAPGVFSFEGKTAAMWEAGTRVRYTEAADIKTVRSAPATFVNKDGRVYFSTSDSEAPDKRKVGYAVDNHGFRVARPNVTIEDIHFQNYFASSWSTGIFVDADFGVIRNCTARNARAGFFVYPRLEPRIEGCFIEDVGCGIYQMGKDSQIHNNTILKKRDAFVVPTYWQDDNGIQNYYPADNGVITGNLVKGYNFGIYAKCRGKFRVEHNTVIGAFGSLYRSNWANGNIYRYNVIVDTINAFHNPMHLKAGTIADQNLIFRTEQISQFQNCLRAAVRAGNTRNVVADPLFVDEANGDYRLMPDSPAVQLATGDRPWGAMSAIAMPEKDMLPPSVSVSIDAPAVRAGSTGIEYFENDPWNGGERVRVIEHFIPDADVDYIMAKRKGKLLIDTYDAFGQAKQMQIRFNDDPWGDAQPLDVHPNVTVPEGAGVHRLQVRVADGAGNWSSPTTLRIRLQEQAPKLVGTPTVYANEHGAIISFTTDQPALARVVLSDGQTFEQAMQIKRDWDVMAGGDKVTEWVIPNTEHAVPIIGKGLSGNLQYTIELRDTVRNSSTTEAFTAKLHGPARTLTVSPSGKDAPDSPVFQTIQYAVSRALPGDTVHIKEGVYSEEVYLNHSGSPDAPITIRGDGADKTILDGVRKLPALFRLEGAANIHLDNLELRWFTRRGSGIYAADSPNLTVTNCKIWNMHWGYHWGEGYAMFLHRSPGLTCDRNLMVRLEVGVCLLESDHAKITHNTAVMCLLGAVQVNVRSDEGTIIQNNCFTFNGNDQIYLEELGWADFEDMTISHNNLGTELRESNEGGDMSVKAPHGYLRSTSKAIIYHNGKRFLDMETYRKETPFGEGSIFVDPKFVDPLNHDFRLQKDSPNIGAGTNGSTIGAFGVAE